MVSEIRKYLGGICMESFPTAREILRLIGDPEEKLEKMSDEECEKEVQEIYDTE